MSVGFLEPSAPRNAMLHIFVALMRTTSLHRRSALFLRCSAPSHMTESGSMASCFSYSPRSLVRRSAIALKRSRRTWEIELPFISTL